MLITIKHQLKTSIMYWLNYDIYAWDPFQSNKSLNGCHVGLPEMCWAHLVDYAAL